MTQNLFFSCKGEIREVKTHFQETPSVFRSPWLSTFPERALTLDLDFYAPEEKNEIEISVALVYETLVGGEGKWYLMGNAKHSQRKA